MVKTNKKNLLHVYLFIHQRAADDRASKAADLEQKVALLEVITLLFLHMYGHFASILVLALNLLGLEAKEGSESNY